MGKDIEQVIIELQAAEHYVYPVDWHLGTGIIDKFIDLPPYSQKYIHLRLLLEEYPCTSIGLIIIKDGLRKNQMQR